MTTACPRCETYRNPNTILSIPQADGSHVNVAICGYCAEREGVRATTEYTLRVKATEFTVTGDCTDVESVYDLLLSLKAVAAVRDYWMNEYDARGYCVFTVVL